MNNPNIEKIGKRKNALDRIVFIAKRVSAKAAYHVSILAELSIILTNTNPDILPPALVALASGIGINLISSLIERIAKGEHLSDEELLDQISLAINESISDHELKKIEQVLAIIEQVPTREEFNVGIRNFTEGLTLRDLLNAINRSENQRNSSAVDKRNIPICIAIDDYIKTVAETRSENTTRAYRCAMDAFQQMLATNGSSTKTTDISALNEEAFYWFTLWLKDYSPATERLYLQAAAGFYEFLAAEDLAQPNLQRIRQIIRLRGRRTGQRLPQFPRTQIDDILDYATNIVNLTVEDETENLRNMRDRAFLITLADTGLRVHEACSLRRGDIDWNEGRCQIIGKGDQEAIVRFSNRSLKALKDHLSSRATLDGSSGKPLTSLPLFARHDRGAGKKVKPITTTTGRNIVTQRVREALGADAIGTITPHSFRHYFVTTVLRGSGGNLKLAQELARHKNIAVTQRYAHLSDDELDKGYLEIFDQV